MCRPPGGQRKDGAGRSTGVGTHGLVGAVTATSGRTRDSKGGKNRIRGLVAGELNQRCKENGTRLRPSGVNAVTLKRGHKFRPLEREISGPRSLKIRRKLQELLADT